MPHGKWDTENDMSHDIVGKVVATGASSEGPVPERTKPGSQRLGGRMNGRVHKILLAALLASGLTLGRRTQAQEAKAPARRRNGRAMAATRPVRNTRRSIRSAPTISIACRSRGSGGPPMKRSSRRILA